MSSPEIQRGLLANCVAARVQVLTDPLHHKLCWWLQKVSWQPGGLDKLAEEIMQRWPERFLTETIQRLGVGADRIYSADEVKEARESMGRCRFPLRGELPDSYYLLLPDRHNLHLRGDERQRRRLERARVLRRARSHPKTYPASEFVTQCAEAARIHFGKFLFENLCLNPSVEFNERTLWYCPRWVETLAELHDLHAAKEMAGGAVTQIGAEACETLEYALSERCLVVIDGLARTGKTFAVKAWCEAHPGVARYMQVPSSNDEISFYRALCDALGLGSSRAYKGNDLRAKVESVLQTGDLLLVLDEGHYLWPQRNVRQASIPQRINWLLTQLVNMGVPVAIVTTPQFTKSQEAIVRNGGWSSEQLIGRIMHYQRLPETLGEEDLTAVARYWMPGGDEKAIRLLITYAQSSEKYLQGIESLVRRARFLASKAGHEQPTFQDVAAALKEGVVPSDNALAAALSTARTRRKVGRPAAIPVQARCIAPARAVQPPVKPTFTPPVRDTGDALLST